jgi:hypothetical protein
MYLCVPSGLFRPSEQVLCAKIVVLWDITSWSPLKVNRHFGGICRLHLHACFLLGLFFKFCICFFSSSFVLLILNILFPICCSPWWNVLNNRTWVAHNVIVSNFPLLPRRSKYFPQKCSTHDSLTAYVFFPREAGQVSHPRDAPHGTCGVTATV